MTTPGTRGQVQASGRGVPGDRKQLEPSEDKRYHGRVEDKQLRRRETK